MEKKPTYYCHICDDPKGPVGEGKTFKFLGTYGYARDHYHFVHKLDLSRDGGVKKEEE